MLGSAGLVKSRRNPFPVLPGFGSLTCLRPAFAQQYASSCSHCLTVFIIYYISEEDAAPCSCGRRGMQEDLNIILVTLFFTTTGWGVNLMYIIGIPSMSQHPFPNSTAEGTDRI